jgi:hypothetical protein
MDFGAELCQADCVIAEPATGGEPSWESELPWRMRYEAVGWGIQGVITPNSDVACDKRLDRSPASSDLLQLQRVSRSRDR